MARIGWVQVFVDKGLSHPSIRALSAEEKAEFERDLEEIGEKANYTVGDSHSPTQDFLGLNRLTYDSADPRIPVLLKCCLSTGGLGISEEVAEFAAARGIPRERYIDCSVN
jgi:hypothetical protein